MLFALSFTHGACAKAVGQEVATQINNLTSPNAPLPTELNGSWTSIHFTCLNPVPGQQNTVVTSVNSQGIVQAQMTYHLSGTSGSLVYSFTNGTTVTYPVSIAYPTQGEMVMTQSGDTQCGSSPLSLSPSPTPISIPDSLALNPTTVGCSDLVLATYPTVTATFSQGDLSGVQGQSEVSGLILKVHGDGFCKIITGAVNDSLVEAAHTF